MNPDLTDPHNHVPEVSPDDVWGDTDGTTVLPPKRVKSTGPGGQSATRADEGLRIESNPQRMRTEDPEERLEVQEIDGTVVRLSPEEILPQRVPRQVTAFQERPVQSEEGRRRRGELSEWGLVGRHSTKWIIGTGLGVASVVILAMLMLPTINKSNAGRPNQNAGFVIDPVEQLKDMNALNAMFEQQEEAEKLFRSYAAATVADEVLPLVRDAKSVEPLIRARHRPLGIPVDWNPQDEHSWSIAGEDRGIYGLLEGSLPDYSKFNLYMVPQDGILLIDWKASTGFGTASFDELTSGTGDATEIRAKIAPTGFYNAAFPEDQYRSYQLVSPNKEKSIWCYTRRGEPVDAAIGRIFQQGVILESSTDPVKVTLRLVRGPSEALPNQWLIGEMLHKDWIMP